VPTGTAVTAPRVFLVDADSQLVPQPVQLDAAGLTPVVADLLKVLSTGPDEQARALGLSSALGPDVILRLIDVEGDTARIAVEATANGPSADRLPLAIGQVVLTVTSVAGVDRVRLIQNGKPLEATLPGGEQTPDPVDAEDYASLLVAGSRHPSKAEPAPTSSATPTP
jgi:spore germination protein GerM